MTVSVVIPAYNEEKYISGVLSALQGIPVISEIIVVSDGSTDNTVEEARKWPVKVIVLDRNYGKGSAMFIGFKTSQEENILFLDADLIGLNRQHVLDMVNPVINDEADMTLGIFDNGRLTTDMAQVIAPFLTGQRCIKRSWLKKFNDWEDAGFGIEAALTQFAVHNNLRIKHIVLPAMTHVMKEEKLGIIRGFTYRLKMYWEIVKKVRTGV